MDTNSILRAVPGLVRVARTERESQAPGQIGEVMKKSLGTVGTGLLTLAALAVPASALAADRYVDQGTGHDGSNDCSDPANPCKTVLRGISQAGSGETIFVNGGHTYKANLTLDGGKSLVHKDFAGSGGKAILDGGTDTSNFELTISNAAGKVSGFTIRGDGGPLKAGGPVKITHDVFDDPSQFEQEIRVDSSGKVVIDHDTFIDPTPSTDPNDFQEGVSGGPGRLVAERSSFTGFSEAIGTSASGTAKITHDDISGTHGQTTFANKAIGAAHATVAYNYIHDPGALTSDGVDASDDVDIKGNYIEAAGAEGVAGFSDGAKVTLEDDVITGGTSALYISGTGAHFKATNVTLLGGAFGAIVNDGTHLKLDSSIVGTGGIKAFGSGSCAISYSRGPVKHSGGSGCKEFSTTKDPKFKADGFHLKGSSPLIDRGNPHKPPKHAKDIDGDKRALAGDCGAAHAKKRRDIGADEFKCSSH
jgi:parallel beta helix pectate lyase-like protein